MYVTNKQIKMKWCPGGILPRTITITKGSEVISVKNPQGAMWAILKPTAIEEYYKDVILQHDLQHHYVYLNPDDVHLVEE